MKRDESGRITTATDIAVIHNRGNAWSGGNAPETATPSPWRNAPETVPDPRAPKLIQVIACELLIRGRGTDGRPFRAVRQYFTLDGCLLAEVDPVDENRTELERRLGEVIHHNDELVARKNELESSVASLTGQLNVLIVEKQALQSQLNGAHRKLRKHRILRPRSDRPRRGRSTVKGKRK
jgi:hypothetical protein